MPIPEKRFIWSFDSQGQNGQEAPQLMGTFGTGSSLLQFGVEGIGRAIEPDIANYTYVNISKDFDWTLNDEREEVPRIILKEMTPSASSLLTRSTYYLSQFEDFDFGLINNEPLDSYTGLYITDDTGFIYDIPQLGGSYMMTGNNSFGSGSDALGGALKGAANVATELAGGSKSKLGAGIGALTKGAGAALSLGSLAGDLAGGVREAFGGGAGYYTEQPQFYQHGTGARNYDIKFPLFNTNDYESMIRNFQVAFMLVYQNLPNRNSKQTIRPPCMYEITVPGVSYTPYAYMSKVNVDFLGARREMTIALPFDDPDNYRNIRVTIPEAYEITLSVQELVAHTKNFMFHNVSRKISTGVASIDEGLDDEVDSDNFIVEGVSDFVSWLNPFD
jgi:hypothetical protein